MNYYRDTSYFPVWINQRSSSLELPFCGYIIDKDGVHMDPKNIKVIRGWLAPTNVHEVRQFIGLSGFCEQLHAARIEKRVGNTKMQIQIHLLMLSKLNQS